MSDIEDDYEHEGPHPAADSPDSYADDLDRHVDEHHDHRNDDEDEDGDEKPAMDDVSSLPPEAKKMKLEDLEEGKSEKDDELKIKTGTDVEMKTLILAFFIAHRT